MAKANGFETLLLREEVKAKFMKAKTKMEDQLGLRLTHSQAIEFLVDQILSDSIKLKLKISKLEE